MNIRCHIKFCGVKKLGSFLSGGLLILLFLANTTNLSAQYFGFDIGRKDVQITIPFSIYNGFLVMEVTINRRLPLHFIFDTGAEQTILTKSNFAPLLGLRPERSMKLVGADLSTIIEAKICRKVQFDFGKVKAINQSILLLEEDFFRFEEIAGVPIHGIIGGNFFRAFHVGIDYQKQEITLYRPDSFRLPPGFTSIPVEIKRNKPYLQAELLYGANDSTQYGAKLLVDTGAGLGLLMTNSDEIPLPENLVKGNIGTGLGGYVEGYLGRTEKITFGPFEQRGVITNFQDQDFLVDSTVFVRKNGLIGNRILERFHVIIDYTYGNIYFKPNKKYNKEHEFDKSGILLIAGGRYFQKVYVHSLISSSPAERAGTKKGDQILSVNGIPTTLLGLNNIAKKLRKKEGKLIRLKVKRGAGYAKVSFKLEKIL